MKACRKRKYDTREEAEAQLNVIGPSQLDFSMSAYCCRRCGFWHVGHSSPQSKKVGVLRSEIGTLETRLSATEKPARREWIINRLKQVRLMLAEKLAALEADTRIHKNTHNNTEKTVSAAGGGVFEISGGNNGELDCGESGGVW